MTAQRPRDLVVTQDFDNPGYLWRVEWFDSDGAGYITIFAGQEAEARAKDYHAAIRDGRLDPRIADAQRGGPFTISPNRRATSTAPSAGVRKAKAARVCCQTSTASTRGRGR
jgi:hypothetical protein